MKESVIAMLGNTFRKLSALLLFTLMLAIYPDTAAAKPVVRQNVTKDAEVVRVDGEGLVRFVKKEEWLTAVAEQILTAGDALKTGNYGKMAVLFADGTQIRVNKNSLLMIKDIGRSGAQKGNVLRLDIGEVWSRTKSAPEALRIETPSATAAIRGTDWDIVVDEKGTSFLTVLRGSVELFNDFGMVIVGSGEQAMSEIGKPPAKSFLMRPKDRVQWLATYDLEVEKMIRFYSYRRQESRALLPSVRKKIEDNPSDMSSKVLLAGLLFDLEERDESTKLFDEVLKADTRNGRALTFRGLLALGNGETVKAQSFFAEAVKNLGEQERSEAVLGMVGGYLQKNEIERAALLLTELGQHTPLPIVGLVIVGFHAFQGDFAKAMTACKRYAAQFPDDERFPAFEANVYILTDQLDKVQEAADRSIRINPSYSSAYSVLGFYHYLEGRGREAEDALKKALVLDPLDNSAMNTMGLLMSDKGNYEEAIKIYSGALERYPRDVTLLTNRALVFNDVEDLTQSLHYFQAAADIQPDIPAGFLGLGLIALKEGRTREAIDYALKTSLLEPKYAEPHILLAVAYYQLGEVAKALEEIRLAEELDPNDPIPHNIAYIIYQDTYRIFEAVHEAKKTLELLQYQKSVAPIENSRQGEENLGSALTDFGLNEWGLSYALESYDPLNASSHFFTAAKYSETSNLALSELVQGLILDPLSISSSNRYSDIYRKPRHDLTAGTTLGDVGGGFSQTFEATMQGYIRKPWELSYYLSFETNDDKGYRENGYGRSYALIYGLGAKPDYKNGLFLYGALTNNKSGEPGQITDPDQDDRDESRGNMVTLGYHHRFGYRNYFLGNIFYRDMESEFINPGLYRTEGLTDYELSFLSRFSSNKTRSFFQKGLYDITQIIGGDNTSLITDSTGTVAQIFSLAPIPYTLPAVIDFDPKRSSRIRYKTLAFQTRHQLDIGDNHQFTYGLEYLDDSLRTTYYGLQKTGTIDFCDEFLLPTVACDRFDRVKAQIAQTDARLKHHLLFAYIDDRWKISPNLLIEGSLNYLSLKSENDYSGLHPRLGLVFKAGRHTLRAGYQKWLEPSAMAPTLMPVSIAGLIIDNRRAWAGSRINDYQLRVESRWSDRLYTEVMAERLEFKNPLNYSLQRGESNTLGAAINAILTERIGMFLRYQYEDSKNKTDAYDGLNIENVPWHSASGGIVWVSPKYVKAQLVVSYVGRRFSDAENTYKMSDYLTTAFSLMWEPLKKHIMCSLSVNNIFDKHYETARGYPAAGRSAFLSAEYRF